MPRFSPRSLSITISLSLHRSLERLSSLSFSTPANRVSSSNVKIFSFSHEGSIVPSRSLRWKNSHPSRFLMLSSCSLFLSLFFSLKTSPSYLVQILGRNTNLSDRLYPSSVFFSFACLLLSFFGKYQPPHHLHDYSRSSPILSLKRDRHARQNGGKRQPTKFESFLPLLAFLPLVPPQ